MSSTDNNNSDPAGGPVQAVPGLPMPTFDLADHVPDSFLVLLGNIDNIEAGPVV